MSFTAMIYGGKHSGKTFNISTLVTAIEIPDTNDDGDLVQFTYYRQPTVTKLKHGDVVFTRRSKNNDPK